MPRCQFSLSLRLRSVYPCILVDGAFLFRFDLQQHKPQIPSSVTFRQANRTLTCSLPMKAYALSGGYITEEEN